MIELIKEFPNFHKYKIINNLRCVEVFLNAPIRQKIEDLEIVCEKPISYLKFEKNQSILATQIIEYKASLGYSDIEDYNIYLNKTLIKDINTDNFKEYIHLFKEKNNIYLIEHLNYENYNYFLQKMVIPVCDKEELNEEFITKTVNWWKNKYNEENDITK